MWIMLSKSVDIFYEKNAWLNVECNEGTNEVQPEVLGAHCCSPTELVFLFPVWVLQTAVRLTNEFTSILHMSVTSHLFV